MAKDLYGMRNQGKRMPILSEPRLKRRGRRRGNLTISLSLGFIGIVVILAVLAPVLPLADPNAQSLSERVMPPLSPGAVLGTDELGRDILSRLVHGARISLLVAISAVVIGGTLGTLLGLLAGYYRGIIDDIVSWLINVQLAFPFILLMIAVVAVLGPGVLNLIAVLGIGSWAVYARVVRGQVLAISEQDFIKSGQTIGASNTRILVRHVLPNVLSPLIVILSFEVAVMIIMESSMSFLGLGVGPDTPSWGSMIADGRPYMQNAWWLTALPGLAIVGMVLAINLSGDWLRDVLDPRQRRKS